MPPLINPMRHLEIEFAGYTIIADISGALYIPDEKILVVADLHFGKGMRLAAGGALVPPYDLQATLHRLEKLIRSYRPETIVSLGDGFDDLDSLNRLSATDRHHLITITNSTNWIWISGNHDPTPVSEAGGDTMNELKIAKLTLRHEANHDEREAEISGHFHPKARVTVRGRSQVRRCFVTNGTRTILPAFGSYTGGLDVTDPAISGLFGSSFDALVLGDRKLYRISSARLS